MKTTKKYENYARIAGLTIGILVLVLPVTVLAYCYVDYVAPCHYASDGRVPCPPGSAGGYSGLISQNGPNRNYCVINIGGWDPSYDDCGCDEPFFGDCNKFCIYPAILYGCSSNIGFASNGSSTYIKTKAVLPICFPAG